ncbi:outer membrane receptor protein [Thioclava sp. SK-1]|uniref:FepA family TonB-dependent siderophore receptor n=1 Tax=Thioclava sp. SK-1 TaxID=1889770 RepID=UPI0008243BAF|nr:FepA family TonB-dependent siderophore receptor [Thioclava sp. SK-1]OCX60988.1 outer membrane receptor protein [Thioclava sp. SK-1]
MARFTRMSTALSLIMTCAALPALAQDLTDDEALDFTLSGTDTFTLDEITVLSFEEEVLQSLGVSEISAEEIAEMPVANDISELVRKMPGVNLTGASATGQRGNQRQIDIRGMGPENTLILIDGKPVLSRNAVRMGRGGERDTRGDSNWVAPELIERIEVIRGPAAARYGSGAAGGVVNIITKKPDTENLTISEQWTVPESGMEGETRRLNVIWSRPINDSLSFRLTGNYNKTDGDDPNINDIEACEADEDCISPAGKEGVVNKDIGALLRWDIDDMHRVDFEVGYSRQGNIYAGDSQLSNGTELTEALVGSETNIMRRKTAAITHYGTYSFGESTSYIQYEHTDNKRLNEGSAGSTEGRINSAEFATAKLDNITAKTEWDMPGQIAGKQAVWTLGGEIRYERIDDPVSISTGQSLLDGASASDELRASVSSDPIVDQTLIGLYGEGNIEWSDRLDIAPSIRADWSDSFGANISGSINASYEISPEWTAKFGIARAFKAPNLYQLSEGYVYRTRGNGCPIGFDTSLSNCYVLGNPDLDPETSTNIEIGVGYSGMQGIDATVTAFYNDYRNKIQAGTNLLSSVNGENLFQWENIPRAVVSGVEGSFAAPLGDNLKLTTNFTYMAKSENKETGDPLSLVPKYTVNAALEWQATEAWTIIPSLTHYGKIDARQNAYTNNDIRRGYSTQSRDPYTIANLTTRYEISDTFQMTGGVTNLFDKQIKRTGDGANTFNEPGRAFYVGLSKTF